MDHMDMVIAGGTMVRSDRSFRANLAIKGGRIADIVADEMLAEATQVADAQAKIVMAGVIDTHVHMRSPDKEEREAAVTGGMAAAAGGVKTFLDMPNNVPPVNCASVLLARRDTLSRQALVDFSLYSGDGEANVGRIPELAGAGAVAPKTFLRPYSHRKDEFESLACTNDDAPLDIFEAVAKTGLVQVVHPERRQ